MRILHLTGYVTGGAGIAVMRLHRALLRERVDSKVLCMFSLEENLEEGVFLLNQKPRLRKRILKRLGLDEASRLTKNLTGSYETFTFPFSGYRLHEHPLVQASDVIHLHWISDFVDLRSFFREVKKPIVWTAHDLNPVLGGFHYEKDVLRNPAFAVAEQKLRSEKHHLIREANLQLIGSSSLTVNTIRSYLPDVKCTLIPCVLETESFVPVDKKVAREALRLGTRSTILGIGADNLGNYRKGFWLLKEAIDGLTRDEKSAIALLSFGVADSRRNEGGIVEEIINLGPVSDQRIHSLIYSAMDYFVIPSLEETFGLTGAESMLCNTPLIASRTGGMADYSDEGRNGFLFEPGNAEELRQRIRRALRDSREGDNFADVRSSILSWYQTQNPVEKHLTLYNSLLEK